MRTGSGPQDFVGATFFGTSFKGATMRACDLSGVTMRSADVDGLDIDGQDLLFGSLFVNGVDVVPLVDAELDRQFPGRALQNAQTPEGLRDGWVAVRAAWAATVADTPPGLVDAHVDDEWSLAQTLRHLVLATDAWLRGGATSDENSHSWRDRWAHGIDRPETRRHPPENDTHGRAIPRVNIAREGVALKARPRSTGQQRPSCPSSGSARRIRRRGRGDAVLERCRVGPESLGELG